MGDITDRGEISNNIGSSAINGCIDRIGNSDCSGSRSNIDSSAISDIISSNDINVSNESSDIRAIFTGVRVVAVMEVVAVVTVVIVLTLKIVGSVVTGFTVVTVRQ